jgi:hypothetical protein
VQLEDPSFDFEPRHDPRPRMPEPLPVRLIAVNDVRLESPAGRERQLDAFYVRLLGMERADLAGDAIVYRAENFDVRFEVLEPPIPREDFRPLRVEVRSLAEAELKLIDAKIEYLRRRGLVAADESLLLQDPADNWVELTQSRIIG